MCQKIKYTSSEEAQNAIKQIKVQNRLHSNRFSKSKRSSKKNAKKLKSYFCQVCKSFHLTTSNPSRKTKKAKGLS